MIGETPLLGPDRFLALDNVTHLAAGGEAPILMAHAKAAMAFFADKGGGMDGRARMLARVNAVKEQVGAFLNLSADEIAFLLNSSDGMWVAAAGLQAGPGDNVVVARSEYVSLPLALQQLIARGVEVRYAGAEIVPEMADFEALVDSRTRAIAVTQVSHLTGVRFDLAKMRALAELGRRAFAGRCVACAGSDSGRWPALRCGRLLLLQVAAWRARRRHLRGQRRPLAGSSSRDTRLAFGQLARGLAQQGTPRRSADRRTLRDRQSAGHQCLPARCRARRPRRRRVRRRAPNTSPR